VTPELTDTIVALSGGVTNLDPQDAADNVRGWLGVLAAADFPHAEEIREALSELASRLEEGEFGPVTDLMARLGNLTIAAASSAPSSVAESVGALGQALHDASNQPL
jgi:hypothetical protein